MTEADSIYNIVTLKNIDDEDFEFAVNSSPYFISANEVRNFPKFMAQYAVKHLIDKILNKRGIATNNVAKREELAGQIVINEEVFARPKALSENERNREMVDKYNKPSDIDEILKKRREALRAATPATDVADIPPTPDAVIPTNIPARTDVPVIEPPTEEFAGLKTKPVETNEDGASKLPAQVGVPNRAALIAYAQNVLGLDLDKESKIGKETMDKFDAMSDEELAKELDYTE